MSQTKWKESLIAVIVQDKCLRKHIMIQFGDKDRMYSFYSQGKQTFQNSESMSQYPQLPI